MNSEIYLNDVYEKLGNLKYDFRNINLTKFLLKKIKYDNILEIGSGNGILLNELYNTGINIEGLEPSKNLVNMSLKLNNKLIIHNTTLEQFKANKKYDTILMIDVLEHMKNDINVINIIYSLLNKNGIFILFVPVNKWLYGKRDKKLGHYRRYNKKELYNVLSKCNFNILYNRYWNLIGVLPYFICEKILNKEFNSHLREEKNINIFYKSINKLLNLWFYYIENNINFKFGFSLFVISQK